MRFLIHIGYPKTATTTLQHKVLLELHKEKKINFLGKTLVGFNPCKELITSLDDNNIVDCSEFFNHKLVNILSEEAFSMNYKHFVSNFMNRDINRITENLNNVFPNAKVIVSIRNHADLIYSLFIECYVSHFRHFKDLNTPQKFINELFKQNPKYKDFFKMYFFMMRLFQNMLKFLEKRI